MSILKHNIFVSYTVKDSSGLGKISRQTLIIHKNGIIKDSGGKYNQMRSFSDIDDLGNSLNSEMWRTWGASRAEFSVMEVEGCAYPNLKKKYIKIEAFWMK